MHPAQQIVVVLTIEAHHLLAVHLQTVVQILVVHLLQEVVIIHQEVAIVLAHLLVVVIQVEVHLHVVVVVAVVAVALLVVVVAVDN